MHIFGLPELDIENRTSGSRKPGSRGSRKENKYLRKTAVLYAQDEVFGSVKYEIYENSGTVDNCWFHVDTARLRGRLGKIDMERRQPQECV